MSLDGIRAALGLPRPALDSDHRAEPLDGRNIDADAGILSGEGSHQHIAKRRLEKAYPLHEVPVHARPTHAGVEERPPDYYGQPMLKEPVWTWMIPTYFFVGGIAGASSALGGAVLLAGGERLRGLERSTRYVGVTGDLVSSALLIFDLGRPSRFLYMLRLLRVTSPMSVGSWVLAGSGALNTVGALATPFGGPVRKLGDAASLGASLLGLPLAGYTAVLIANSAVPVWQHTRKTMPLLFVGSAIACAGATLQLVADDQPATRRTLRAFTLAGQLAELAFGLAVEREASRATHVDTPLHSGFSGALWKASKVLTAGALALNLFGRTRPLRRVGAVAGLAGGFALRWAVFLAGKRSARDPQASFQAQRAGLGGTEVTGTPPQLGAHDSERSFRLPVVQQPTT